MEATEVNKAMKKEFEEKQLRKKQLEMCREWALERQWLISENVDVSKYPEEIQF